MRLLLASLLLTFLAPALDSESAETRGPSTDLYGDTIPSGAVVRLGTARFRVENNVRNGIVFSRDGKTLVSLTLSGQLCWWDSRTGKLRSVADAMDRDFRCTACAASPDSTTIAMMGFRSGIQIWDIDSAQRIGEVPWNDPRGCQAMVYTPDGQSIITGDSAGMLRVLDLATKEWLLDFQLPEKREVSAIAVSPDGQLIAATISRRLFIWKWLEGQEPKVLEGFGRVNAIAFAADSKRLAVSRERYYGGPELMLWDVARNRVTGEFRPPAMTLLRVYDLEFSPDGQLLAAPNCANGGSTRDNALLIWNIESGELVQRVRSENTRPVSVAFSRDQRLIAACSAHEIAVWDLKTGERRAEELVGHTASVTSVRFTPDNTQVVTSSDDGTARSWDVGAGKPLAVFQHGGEIRAMSVSPDGKWVATSSLDDTVRLWDAATGKEVYRLPGHGATGGCRAIEFSSDSSRFATWGEDMYLRVWDVRTGKALVEEQAEPGEKGSGGETDPFDDMFLMNDGVLSADASRLLVSDREGTYLFDATTANEIRKVPSHQCRRAACFAPDASRLLLARAVPDPAEAKSQAGRVRRSGPEKYEFVLMNLEDDSVLWTFRIDGLYGPMAFSPDGRLVAVSTRLDRSDDVFFLDAATGKKLAEIPEVKRLGWASNGLRMAFSQDGQRFAAGLHNTTALVWKLSDLRIETWDRARGRRNSVWRD